MIRLIILRPAIMQSLCWKKNLHKVNGRFVAMSDYDDKVDRWEFDQLQEQVYDLQAAVEQLQMENTLLRNDLNTITNEGCWRFIEDAEHKHK